MSWPAYPLVWTVLGPSFVFQCGWHVCCHFLLSQTTLWQFICHHVRKLKILGLIQNQLTWGSVCCDELGFCQLVSQVI